MNQLKLPFSLILGALTFANLLHAEESSDNHCEYPVSQYKPADIPANQLHLSADSMEVQNKNTLSLHGKVEIITNEQRLLTDDASFDRETKSITAKGGITLQREELNFTGDALELELTQQKGSAKNTQYQITKSHGNGFAESIEFGDGQLQLKNANYTTCPPKQKAWQISAKEISLNEKENEGIARGAKIEVFSVPIFYIPYISFPLEGRKTGMLPPTPAYSSTDGVDLLVPYYVNLAPNYDMTLNPRFIQKRGAQLGAEFRYLHYDFAGEFGAEYLPSDKQRNIDRYQASFKQQNYISSTTWLTTNLTHVSDVDYYSDLGTSLSIANKSQLDRHIVLETSGSHWFLRAMLQDYQMLNRLAEPYRRLPQLDFYSRQQYAGLYGDLFSQYSYFFKNHIDKVQRLVINPSVSLPLHKSYGHITPTAGLYGAGYQTQNEQLTHKQWYIHTSGALYLDRKSNFGTHTLIPHFSYLNMPYESQAQQPQIDSDLRPLGYDELFLSRRYSGWDRFGDIHRVSWGVRNQWFNKQGQALAAFNLALAQILEDQHMNMPGDTAYEKSDTIYASSVSTSLTPNLKLNGEILTVNQIEKLESAAVSAHYAQSDKDQVELRHDYRSNVLQQTSLILTKTLNNQWRIATRWAYSNKHHQIREGLFGLEYNNCCWSLRLVARRYASVIDEEAKNAVSVQFELKGLTAIGSQLEKTFSQEIFGIE